MCRGLYVIKGSNPFVYYFKCETVGDLKNSGLKFEKEDNSKNSCKDPFRSLFRDDHEDTDCLCGVNVRLIADLNGLLYKWLSLDDVAYSPEISMMDIEDIIKTL